MTLVKNIVKDFTPGYSKWEDQGRWELNMHTQYTQATFIVLRRIQQYKTQR